MPLRRTAFAAALVLLAAPSAPACKFHYFGEPRTLREHAAAADFVLFVRIANPRGTPEGGSTDLVVLAMLKAHPAVEERAVVTLPRLLPIPDPKDPPLYLVFGAAANGNLDFFHGEAGTTDLADYARRVLALDPKDAVRRLRFCFDHLEHADAAIAADAFRELTRAPDASLRLAAPTFAPDDPRRWLRTEGTPAVRLNLYATLLGHCGTRGDAALLRQVADKLLKQEEAPLLDGLLRGYTLLDPQASGAWLGELMKEKEFMVRYAVLKTVRYFHATRPDVLPEAERFRLMRLALDQPDLADLPVEDLRKWKCWALTDEVLSLPSKPAFQVPIVRRSVLRYALQCPDPAAAKYVAEVRTADPERLKFVEDMLKEEATPTKQ
jgi:hypothetical protein